MLPYNCNSLSKLSIIHYALCFALLFSACDSGDIVEKTFTVDDSGYVVKLTTRLIGADSLDSKYTLAIAGYASGDNYARMQQTLPAPDANGSVSIAMSNISEQLNTVEFVLSNRRRERILSLATISLTDYDAESRDTIRMELGDIDVSMIGILQRSVFDVACIQCHGGNGGNGAANLNLTQGKAFANLIDVASTRKEGMKRVASGDAEASLLHNILSEGGEGILHVNHTEILSNQFRENLYEVRQFIDDWIERLKE